MDIANIRRMTASLDHEGLTEVLVAQQTTIDGLTKTLASAMLAGGLDKAELDRRIAALEQEQRHLNDLSDDLNELTKRVDEGLALLGRKALNSADRLTVQCNQITTLQRKVGTLEEHDSAAVAKTAKPNPECAPAYRWKRFTRDELCAISVALDEAYRVGFHQDALIERINDELAHWPKPTR